MAGDRDRAPSRTALGTAYLRAVHQLLDAPPRILEDPVAVTIQPWRTWFTPEELDARLRSAGFSTVEFLSPEEAEARYFRGRPQDLPVPKRTGIACAVV